MKKITIFVIGIILATSFMGIFSIECIAQSPPEAPTDFPATPISKTSMALTTTVTGLFFDIQQSPLTVSFYAIRIHYWTTGPFNEQGVINFKSCTGGMIIGPISLIRIGPLHQIILGTFTFLGNIRYSNGGSGQGIINTLLTT
jgi:hypothetical protein